MKLAVKPRQPKWIVVSAYVGKKKSLRGLNFPTRFTFYRKKLAERMAGVLNSRAANLDRWPARDFEFQVIPYVPSTDALKEAL